jgi:hypothetical protein
MVIAVSEIDSNFIVAEKNEPISKNLREIT